MSAKYQPLYLKHRPQALNELVGQASVVRTLKNAIDNDRVAHAYLFTGPRGTGKTSSARILAKSLNCAQGPTAEPCLTCASCEEIKSAISPSVFEIDAASNNSVDDARTLIERAPLVAQGGRFKLYIVDECHMLTKEAFNALLKTIEEPPPSVIFILATTEENKVPPTIVSRCQRLMFRLVSHEDLLEHLRCVATRESIEIEEEALEVIARRAGGGLRDALGLLDQASLLGRPGEPVSQSDLLVLLGALHEDVLLSLSEAVIARDGKRLIESVHGLLTEGREPPLIALELAKHFLNLAKASYVTGKERSELSRFILGTGDYIEGLVSQSDSFERAELSQIIERLDRLETALKRSTLPSLTLEMGLLSICHRHEIQSLTDLTARIEQLEQQLEDPGYVQSEQRPARPRPVAAAEPVVGQPGTSSPPAARRAEAQRSAPSEPAVSPSEPAPIPASAAVEQKDLRESEPSVSTEVSGPEEDDDALLVHAAPPVSKSESSGEPVTGSTGASTASVQALEEIWSELLDALHKRSIPAYSLISMHAFPVRLENDTLTLGVRKEFFQKSIENKANALEQAYRDVASGDVRVLVKVFSEDSALPDRSAERPAGGERAAPSPEPRPDSSVRESRRDESEQLVEPERAGAYKSGDEEIPSALADDDSPPERERIEPASIHSRERDPGGSVAQETPSPEQRQRGAPEKSGSVPEVSESSLIREAYSIFEGPGSRLIG